MGTFDVVIQVKEMLGALAFKRAMKVCGGLCERHFWIASLEECCMMSTFSIAR